MTRAQAVGELREAGFRAKFRRERSFVPDGIVFEQTPEPGKRPRIRAVGTSTSRAGRFLVPARGQGEAGRVVRQRPQAGRIERTLTQMKLYVGR